MTNLQDRRDIERARQITLARRLTGLTKPGAKVVRRMRWWHRLYNATPLFIRRRFCA